jgi:hypothetical protein
MMSAILSACCHHDETLFVDHKRDELSLFFASELFCDDGLMKSMVNNKEYMYYYTSDV